MIMKNILLLLFIVLFSFSCKQKDTQKTNKNPYLVVVSMDAFRWDYADMYNTPNLDKIAKNGIVSEGLIPAFPSKTFPNHYTLATGLYPDNHGIVNNTFFDSTRNVIYKIRDREKVQDGYFYGGEPIWNTVEKNNMKAASYFWVGSEANVQNMHPSYYKLYSSRDPFENRIDTVINWLNLPQPERPNLCMLYFHEPDGVGHDYGPEHVETQKVVEYMDSLVGDLYSKLNNLPHADSINLIILSDHGMGNISEDKTVIISKDIDTSLIEIAAGSNPVFNIKAKDGKLEELYNKTKKVKGISVWKTNEIPSRLNYGKNPRTLDMVVVADSSWSIVYKLRSNYDFGGTHGYDPANTDMHAIFYAIGPAFKEDKKIGRFNNVDIYNIMCKTLEINPAINDGDTTQYVIFK
jgi:alkaline phosphatase D